MNKNDIVTLEITGLTNEGFGVAHCDGMAVFVPYSAVGDVAECRVVKVMKTYAYARLERIISPSSDRIEPDCEVFGRCGGCCFRHIAYEAELRAKEGFVKEAFRRIGGLDIPIEPIISAADTARYRNKAQLPVEEINGKTVCGFYSPRSHRVVSCSDCRLAPKVFSEIIGVILDYHKSCGLSCYDPESCRGLLRHIYLRRGHYSGETAVCLIVSEKTDAYSGLVPLLTSRFPDIKTVLLNINSADTNVILGNREYPLYGDGTISDTICGVNVKIAARSFYQVNTPAAEAVYRKAGEYANLSGDETLLDLYCGAGTVGLSMIRGAARLIGVEVVEEAVKNARENAERNGVKNAEFIVGDAGKIAKMLAERGERPDVIVVDPPRKGCDTLTLDSIVKMSPKRVVMISCNPATAARDVKYLAERGYTAQKACPADMFPRTQHVETVVQLSKGEIQSKKIRVDFSLEDMDMSGFQKGTTYGEIKAYVKEHTGLSVSSLYIAQVKQKCGIIERENYNKPKLENVKQPQCPPEKEAAIRAALEHFRMI